MTNVRHILLFILSALAITAVAAPQYDTDELMAQLDSIGTGRQNVFRGKYHTVTPEGDTVLVLVMNNITVLPPLKFKNKKEEEFYWRTVRDVRRSMR